jgi:hypothetical protein
MAWEGNFYKDIVYRVYNDEVRNLMRIYEGILLYG